MIQIDGWRSDVDILVIIDLKHIDVPVPKSHGLFTVYDWASEGKNALACDKMTRCKNTSSKIAFGYVDVHSITYANRASNKIDISARLIPRISAFVIGSLKMATPTKAKRSTVMTQ